jgi:hypothetical protein
MEIEDEIIPEIQPRKRGPKRRKKPEIIPEIIPRKISREEEETDSTIPYLDQWTDDEADAKKIKNPSLTLPRIEGNIDMWNTYGEKFSGKVIKVGKRKFKIREHETGAELWIELEKLNYWDYCESQEVPKVNRTDGNPSLFALRTI